MSKHDSEWVVVGKIGRPQGINGLVRINSYTEPKENLLSYPDWYIEKNEKHVRLKRIEEKTTPQYIAAKLEGYTSREAVATLTHAVIVVPRGALHALGPDEYYWHELEGMKVLYESGEVIGVVDSLFSTGSNDVLVVVGEKKHLIPYLLDDVIQEINRESREITVRWDLEF